MTTGRLDGCGTIAPLDWPVDPAAIELAVVGLPESERQWRPEPASQEPATEEDQ
jgi:hypothetical protein